MLDANIISQLHSVFADLKVSIDLVMAPSSHAQQPELVAMLEAVAGTSPNIQVRENGYGRSEVEVQAEDPGAVAIPQFSLRRDGKATGITFRGIPGGHEFTSLIIAILNAGGRGKLPDPGLADQIRAIPNGIALRTYVSLSCENCPDIVQALNVMALINPGIKHTMIDGGLVPDEVAALGLQGVPAVFVGEELLHSGRGNLAELLQKLQTKFASQGKPPAVRELGTYDVAVIGGGPAGVAAAIYSARKGLKTILIAEKIGGQVQETKGIENFIGTAYTEGPKLSSSLEEHLRAYHIEILEHRRVLSCGEAVANMRPLILSTGETLNAAAIIVATGAKWRELGIPGEREYLGRGVAFCPHCDGPFYKDKNVAVVGGGNSGVEAAIDLAGIASDVKVIEFSSALKADAVLLKKLNSLPNITVITNAKTTVVNGDGAKVISLTYEDRGSGQLHTIALDGIFVQIGLLPNSAIFAGLVELNPFGEIIVDAKGRTSTPGIYAAGDVTTVPFKQIVIASGEGAKVALAAFEDRMRHSS